MSTKDTVLALFEKNKGFFISGERIAEELSISRTAVWKAVKKLQNEGYEIKAITNRGYCLDKDSDVLTVRGIRSYLSEDSKELRPEVFVTVESTNTLCLEKAMMGEDEGYVAIAGAQTAGRGRRGRSFFSPADSGIYMSVLLKPADCGGEEMLRFTPMAAAAACEAISEVSGAEARIKWVNDIQINNKKVCGILTEATSSYKKEAGCVVVGIGINAYAPKNGFPDDIADKAGSVFAEISPGLKNRLAAEILNRFMAYYKDFPEKTWFDSYKEHSAVIGKDVYVLNKDGKVKAHVLGLDDECGLIVRYEDGSEATLRSGEISIIL